MTSDFSLRILLAAIAAFLGMIALRPLVAPEPAHAQDTAFGVYVEPGVHTLRAPDGSAAVLGKVMIDLRNGNVWGFPTGDREPYPIRSVDTKPPTSRPILLGRFDLSSMNRTQ